MAANVEVLTAIYIHARFAKEKISERHPPGRKLSFLYISNFKI
jgi:hypothetical protein